MSKNIVICCDGTWNTPDDKDGGVPTPTNVARIFNALADDDASGNPQHRYYHSGVGTDGGWINKLVGGGTGRGLDQNIMSSYYELCRHYEFGDRIFLFGFSRGAYTVRSLAGFINCAGLLDLSSGGPDGATWKQIEHMFQDGYRRKVPVSLNGFQYSIPPKTADSIHFLGVWDTVGALGIPDDMALLNLLDNLHDYRFHNTALSDSIITARHAVALDEMRASFQPTLWTAAEGRDALEVWFPGVHSDVGGGYRDCGLSDCALQWMIDEAGKYGLVFNVDVAQQIKPNPQDVLHNSCDGVFTMLPTQPRRIPMLNGSNVFHPSVLSRQSNPPISQGRYRPQRTVPTDLLDVYSAQPWNDTGIWLTAGTQYTFEARGEWLDAHISCGPGGTDDGKFQIGELAQLAGSALGKLENLFKSLTGNGNADFRFTRRHEDAPWFCLMGAIATGGEPDAKGRPTTHETFKIGDGCTYTPLQSGYFHAYANDAWGLYGNNRGHVRLTITSP